MNNAPITLTFDDETLHQYHIAKILYRCKIGRAFFCATHLDRHPDTANNLSLPILGNCENFICYLKAMQIPIL